MCYQYFVCVIYSLYSHPLCVIRTCFVFVMLFFFYQNDTHVSLEDDDVEMPEFRNKARKAFKCHSDEEIISDDEVQCSNI